ncbi:hypothetical protein HDU67_001898 [Dinochytrium kinnereticum]|nr:hypothetical protein HDU67_001898 [Dinochytrium kinnereticum]
MSGLIHYSDSESDEQDHPAEEAPSPVDGFHKASLLIVNLGPDFRARDNKGNLKNAISTVESVAVNQMTTPPNTYSSDVKRKTPPPPSPLKRKQNGDNHANLESQNDQRISVDEAAVGSDDFQSHAGSKAILLSFVAPGTMLPEALATESDLALQAKIEKWTEMRQQGRLFNEQLARTHSFANPSIMSKLIEYIGLEEYGSNFEKSQFDPAGFPADSYYDEIVKAQKKRVQQEFESIVGNGGSGVSGNATVSAGIQFVSNVGHVLPGYSAAGGLSVPQSSSGKKRSRWDETDKIENTIAIAPAAEVEDSAAATVAATEPFGIQKATEASELELDTQPAASPVAADVEPKTPTAPAIVRSESKGAEIFKTDEAKKAGVAEFERIKKEQELKKIQEAKEALKKQEQEAFEKARILKEKLEAEAAAKKAAEDAKRKDEELARQARLAEQNKRMEEFEKQKQKEKAELEAVRVAEEKRKEAEAFAKLEELKRKTAEEEARKKALEDEKRKEEERSREEKLKKQKDAMEKFEEERRLKLMSPAEREAFLERKAAEERRKEEERLAKEAEEKRKQEEERLAKEAAERAIEEARLAKEAAERAIETERLAKEAAVRAAEEERVAKEKAAAAAALKAQEKIPEVEELIAAIQNIDGSTDIKANPKTASLVEPLNEAALRADLEKLIAEEEAKSRQTTATRAGRGKSLPSTPGSAPGTLPAKETSVESIEQSIDVPREPPKDKTEEGCCEKCIVM